MIVHRYSSASNYAEHITPIWAALPEEVRGRSLAPRESPWGTRQRPPGPDEWVIVASHSDARVMGARPLIHVNHGAGQTYDGDPRSAGHGAYAGGGGLEHVRLFLDPRQECSDLWAARYPDAVTAAVGCPKLDRWHLPDPRIRNPESGFPTVAFTFHHQGGLCPETTWALPHYRDHLTATIEALRGAGCVVIGHGHPRAGTPLRRLWSDLGVEWVPTLGEVFDRADCLVADNTSALPEAASVEIPLVWLSAPWYRRHVEHGGRFWDWPEGQVQVDHPGDLVEGIMLALADPPQIRDARQRMVHTVYAHCDGHAAARAAKAIIALG